MNRCKCNETWEETVTSRPKYALIQQAWLWISFIRAFLKTSRFISDLLQPEINYLRITL